MKNYILRKIKGKSHIFLDKRGNLIKDKKYIDKCLEGVYIAPAYDDVKINLNKKAKVLAIGYDEKGRPQYVYNKKFTEKMKKETINKGIYHLKHGNYEYPITYQLIKDGRRNKVLNKPINIKTKVTMVHGEKDEVVPISYSKKVLKIFPKAKKKMIVIKNGDHSLSTKKWLKIITKELKELI